MIPFYDSKAKIVASLQRTLSVALAFTLVGAPHAVFAGGSFIPSGSAVSTQQPDPSATSSSKSVKHKHTPFDDFLIRGSVFNEKALAFPGVEVRVRRVGEKKFRWQDVTNSRGNFAFRVPHGASYEVVIHMKGFLDQTETVEAKTGSTDKNLSFKLQPAGGKK